MFCSSWTYLSAFNPSLPGYVPDRASLRRFATTCHDRPFLRKFAYYRPALEIFCSDIDIEESSRILLAINILEKYKEKDKEPLVSGIFLKIKERIH